VHPRRSGGPDRTRRRGGSSCCSRRNRFGRRGSFAGSGNTLYWLARHTNTQRAVGFELNQHVFEMSRRNLAILGFDVELSHVVAQIATLARREWALGERRCPIATDARRSRDHRPFCRGGRDCARGACSSTGPDRQWTGHDACGMGPRGWHQRRVHPRPLRGPRADKALSGLTDRLGRSPIPVEDHEGVTGELAATDVFAPRFRARAMTRGASGPCCVVRANSQSRWSCSTGPRSPTAIASPRVPGPPPG
jgi:hypothetical protein